MTPAKGLPYTAFIFVSRVPLKGSFTYLISRSLAAGILLPLALWLVGGPLASSLTMQD